MEINMTSFPENARKKQDSIIAITIGEFKTKFALCVSIKKTSGANIKIAIDKNNKKLNINFEFSLFLIAKKCFIIFKNVII